ncbi:MAG: thiol:disulfide interchange protein DsbA/DsbL [Pseudomonadota bacterium]
MRWITLAALLLSSGAFAQVMGQGGAYVPGKDYKLIEPAQPTDDATQVEVVEVFGYLCPHCATFQPYIEPWSKNRPDRVTYQRVPVVFQRSWEPLARAYYTAEALGILEESHNALFRALHTERRPLRNTDDLANFFTSFGVTREEFDNTAKSFTVQTKLSRGVNQARRWGVTGTPSVVINGKYLANGSMAGSYERLIQIVDHLVAQELAALPPQAEEAAEEDATQAGSSH